MIQLTATTKPESGVFSGRIEHLSSGRRVRFDSREGLLSALFELLGRIDEAGH